MYECPHCSAPVRSSAAKFCSRCGRPLPASLAPVPSGSAQLSLRSIVAGWLMLLLGLLLVLMWTFGRINSWPGGILGIVVGMMGFGILFPSDKNKSAGG